MPLTFSATFYSLLPTPYSLLPKQQLSQAKFSPKLFKGIALFTPGGDLIYCIDPTKQERWHLHLCVGLQEILQLPEPPHFLVPCYTATIDRWLDPRTQQVQTFAEAYPLVLRHQALLNAVFETGELVWQASPPLEALCEPMVLATNRSLFPQLWEDHDLLVRFERWSTSNPSQPLASSCKEKQTLGVETPVRGFLKLHSMQPAPFEHQLVNSSLLSQSETLSYVLRLFVAGHSVNTERILLNLHQLLEQSLRQPYTLKVIDVFKHPEQAEADQVSATPTLVKVWPQPVRRFVGDLDNGEKILQMLAFPEV